MEAKILELIKYTELCLLPKLAKGVNESENHEEYESRLNRLNQYFQTVEKLLGEVDLRKSINALSSVFILFKELKSDGPWNTVKSTEYFKKLNYEFKVLYDMELKNLLGKTSIFTPQEIFDDCLEKLHQKLTYIEHYKYPSLVEVYYSMICEVKTYNVTLCPMKIFPFSLILVDDCIPKNKLKGLNCCKSILQCLIPQSFEDGNYYEVIFGCLNKAVMVKDNETSKLVLECFVLLLKLLPHDVRTSKSDDVLSLVLDELHMESNLYRKATLFNFTKILIHFQKGNCIRRKLIKTVLYDNLDMCRNESVADILLHQVLECFIEWIKHCWCIWQYNLDHEMLVVLFKLLYNCKEEYVENIVKLSVTLICLCMKEEQGHILTNLEKASQIKKKAFRERVDAIKNNIVIK